MRIVNLAGFAAVLALGACGNLTCDQQKQESIKHLNAGVDLAATQSYASAIAELKQALALDKENHQASYQLGQIYVKQSAWDKAGDVLKEAIKYNNKDPMYHYYYGQALYYEQKYDLARTELQAALDLNKKLYKAHFHLGLALIAQEKPREAAVALTEACRLNPIFGKPFFELGKLYYLWDYDNEAARILEQGAANVKDLDDKTDIYYQLGLVYDALKQPAKAVTAYSNAIEAKKDNLEATYGLGMALAEKGDVVEARKQLTEFTKLAGGSAQFSHQVQAAYGRMNKLSQPK